MFNYLPGQYQYRFNKVGKFHFGSGCVDGVACEIFMRLTVEVTDATNEAGNVVATLGEHTVSLEVTCLRYMNKVFTAWIRNLSTNCAFRLICDYALVVRYNYLDSDCLQQMGK